MDSPQREKEAHKEPIEFSPCQENKLRDAFKFNKSLFLLLLAATANVISSPTQDHDRDKYNSFQY